MTTLSVLANYCHLLVPSKHWAHVTRIESTNSESLGLFDLALFADRRIFGRVYEDADGEIVGYIIYRYCKTHFEILRCTVHADHRHRGAGRALVHSLLPKLSPSGRHSVRIVINECNRDGIQFLRAIGFRARRVVREAFPAINEDGFEFVFSVEDLNAYEV